MATEFALAAGLLKVASVGIILTRTLHDLGATAREAGEQTDHLAKSISHHCRALKNLGRQIKVDNPDHSAEALNVARELQEQSDAVLHKIKKLLPSPGYDRGGLTLKHRLLWSLRKSRVDHLVGQLEYLKSTITLLLHVLSTVPKLRSYRRSREQSPGLREEISEELTEAQNLLYERCRAQQNLPELAADDEAEEIRAIAPPDVRSSSPSPPYSLDDIAPHPGNFLAEIDAYAHQLSQNDSRALIMQKTNLWLAQLYGRWTTLSDDDFVSNNTLLDGQEITDLAAATTDDSVTSQVSAAENANSKEDFNPAAPPRLAAQAVRKRVQILDQEPESGHGLRGILRKSTDRFPEDPNPTREGIAPRKEAGKNGVPPGARWTKISRILVDPEALEEANERFEERDDYVIVLRVVSREEVAKLAVMTTEIREAREAQFHAKVARKWEPIRLGYRPPTVEDEELPTSPKAAKSTPKNFDIFSTISDLRQADRAKFANLLVDEFELGASPSSKGPTSERRSSRYATRGGERTAIVGEYKDTGGWSQ